MWRLLLGQPLAFMALGLCEDRAGPGTASSVCIWHVLLCLTLQHNGPRVVPHGVCVNC
jgi:hypothetical protein